MEMKYVSFVLLAIASVGSAADVTVVIENNHIDCREDRNQDIRAALDGRLNVILESVVANPSEYAHAQDYTDYLTSYIEGRGVNVSNVKGMLAHIKGMEDFRLFNSVLVSDIVGKVFSSELGPICPDISKNDPTSIPSEKINRVLNYVRKAIENDPFTAKALSNILFPNNSKAKSNDLLSVFSPMSGKNVTAYQVCEKIHVPFKTIYGAFTEEVLKLLNAVYASAYTIPESETTNARQYADDSAEMGQFSEKFLEEQYLVRVYLRDQFLPFHIVEGIRSFLVKNPNTPVTVRVGAAHEGYVRNALTSASLQIKYRSCGELPDGLIFPPKHTSYPRVLSKKTQNASEYAVYSHAGKLVKSGHEGFNLIDFEQNKEGGFSKGVYFVRYTIEGFIFYDKIVITN